jgi:hypothetical protein
MISRVRDQVLALACLRHGVPAVQGRGMDSLPPEITTALAEALVRSLEIAELKRALPWSVRPCSWRSNGSMPVWRTDWPDR